MSDDLEQLPQDGTSQTTSDPSPTPGAAVDANELAKYKAETERARKEAIQSRQKAREAQTELESIKGTLAEVDTIKATLAEVQKSLADAESARKQSEIQAMRIQAASEVGLPLELASRLQGDSLETIKADAQSLAATLPKGALVIPAIGNGAPSPKPSRADEFLARMNGKQNNPFDRDLHTSKGGGVLKD